MEKTVCGVVVQPPFSPSIMILLEKLSVWNWICDYYIVCQSPAPSDFIRRVGLREEYKEYEVTELEQPEKWEAKLPTERAREIVDLLENGRIRFVVDSTGGLAWDGCVYTFFFGHWHFTAALYRWWNFLPEGWDALGEITGMLLYEARRSYYSVFGKNFNTGIWLSYGLTPTAPIKPIRLE